MVYYKFLEGGFTVNRYPWIRPLVLLAILLLLFAFRWETVSIRPDGVGFMQWTRDRWTNQVWLLAASTSEKSVVIAFQMPINPGPPSQQQMDKQNRLKNNLTISWSLVLLFDLLWLAKSVGIINKRGDHAV